MKIKFVTFSTTRFDFTNTLQDIFLKIGIDSSAIRVPNLYLWEFTTKKIREIKQILKKTTENEFSIFIPNTTELFLKEADFTILFSGYRSWYNADKMRVIPHIWTPNLPVQNEKFQVWDQKPSLNIGFMGKSYTNSKLAKITSTLPKPLKKKLLKGNHLNNIQLLGLSNDLGMSLTYLNSFARVETLKSLMNIKEQNGQQAFKVDIAIRNALAGGSNVDKELKEYVNHMMRNTYILCPRGAENFSYRFYEALSYGRVPVLIDTDVVLPPGINWQELAVIVPYDQISNINKFIEEDYFNKSEAEFLERQKKAIETMENLRQMEWLKDVADVIMKKINRL